MRTFVYGAAVLVAADRNERRAWAEHKVRLEPGLVPLVPAPVVAQVSRSPQQAQLRRFLIRRQRMRSPNTENWRSERMAIWKLGL
jgi:hypothetical protein